MLEVIAHGAIVSIFHRLPAFTWNSLYQTRAKNRSEWLVFFAPRPLHSLSARSVGLNR